MSDLIDRQAAIDALDEQIRQCDKALSAFDISMKDEYAVKVERASLVAFRETFEYMPSAQPGWIPTSKRLPKDFEEVLVWYEYFRYGKYNRMYQTYGVGYYNSEFNIWGGDINGRKVRVFAWMPLPAKPWEGKEQ